MTESVFSEEIESFHDDWVVIMFSVIVIRRETMSRAWFIMLGLSVAHLAISCWVVCSSARKAFRETTFLLLLLSFEKSVFISLRRFTTWNAGS